MSDIPKEQSQWAKEQVTKLARTQFHNLTLIIRTEGERKIAITEQGSIFGYIAREDTDALDETITIHFGIVKDGNLKCIIS